ncbi:MAG: ABC transporter ATP-binding protein [Phycisphaerae bacterium]|nr:ABC transporter ATP-binding protein [Phycisphaerae bacterium]MDW8261432.1 ABC transporter ATP-binding protein [Phycisphaerales bacterium]
MDDVSLEVRDGEFMTFLGPSGCGKTTMLRMISGFETPSSGRVFLGPQDVTDVPPYRRNVNQVFQSYALFPHLSVWDNVAFGLRMKRVLESEIRPRVDAALEMVSLQGMEHRKPGQLSGGQRQRVALARAIVNRPKVLLLDEPLSALDAKLRHGMQIELKRLQQKVGITFIFVTHDQEEALTMSDRIAVINRGRIEQLGGVDEIYHRPRTTFVANFIGQANLLPARIVRQEGGNSTLRIGDCLDVVVETADLPPNVEHLTVSIRPEKVRIEKTRPEGPNVFPARVEEELFKGATDQLVVVTDDGLRLTAIVANESAAEMAIHEGDRVYCQLHEDDIVVVQSDGSSAPE